MKRIRVVAFIGMIAMLAVIVNGFVNGDFFEDGRILMANPWGVTSLVDLYVGFVLFSMWILYRETSLRNGMLWTLFMMVFGFLTASVYLFYLSFKEDEVTTLLLGRHR